MEDMFKAGGNKNYSIHELKNMNHLFQTVVPENIQNPADIDETISPIVLDLVSSWIMNQMSDRKNWINKRTYTDYDNDLWVTA